MILIGYDGDKTFAEHLYMNIALRQYHVYYKYNIIY